VHAGVRAGVGEQQHLIASSFGDGGDDRQGLVVDLHQLGGVDRARAAFAQYHRDDVAHEPHRVRGQKRPEHPLVDP
jgi:hypothetical protein